MGLRCGIMRADLQQIDNACDRIREHIEAGRIEYALTLLGGIGASIQERLRRLDDADELRYERRTGQLANEAALRRRMIAAIGDLS